METSVKRVFAKRRVGRFVQALLLAMLWVCRAGAFAATAEQKQFATAVVDKNAGAITTLKQAGFRVQTGGAGFPTSV